jgi:hypothetical protein
MKTGRRNFSVGSQFGNAWRDDYGLETKHKERMLTICGCRVRQREDDPFERSRRRRNPEANLRVSQDTDMISYEVGEQNNNGLRGDKIYIVRKASIAYNQCIRVP